MQITRFNFSSSPHWLTHLYRQRSWMLWLVGVLFVFVNAAGLSLVKNGRLQIQHFIGPLLWFAAYGVLLWGMRRYRPQHDPYILPILSFLTGWGVLLIDRLADNFLARQITWVLLGTAVVALLQLPTNYKWLRRYRYTLLTLGLLLLGTTFILGVNPSGAASANYWLQLPFRIPIYFQPSELLKLLLVIFLASYFDQQEFLLPHSASSTKQGLLPLIAPIGLMGGFCLLLLVWQRDLGAATLFFILFLGLFYLATGKRRLVIAGFALLFVAGGFAYWQFDVVALRVDAWLNPWPDADGRAFQIVQSLYAIATGGVFGQGIGQGFPIYIPVVHSDFVFAAIAEEWGLIGSLTVVGSYALLMHRGVKIALRQERPFYRYLAMGITILLSTQAILIMGGVTKLLPLTGVTLPFMSYGGSSMLVSHIMIGLLLFASTKGQPSPNTPSVSTAVRQHLFNIHISYIIGFTLVALSLIFWPLIRAGTILVRTDNPRQVENALRIQRGQIIDSQGRVLAETIGTENSLQRHYPLAQQSGPAVGYYSFRHGTAGIEDGYDEWLNGDEFFFHTSRFLERNLLHRPTVGGDIQLTIDGDLQQAASELIGDSTGGILLLHLSNNASQTAEILAMVSQPTYDPNALNAEFDALIDDASSPLLNRTTLGQYQPGMVLQPFIMATAVQHDNLTLSQPYDPDNDIVVLNDQVMGCVERPVPRATWANSVLFQCEVPLRHLGDQLGEAGLEQTFANFGLTLPISLPLDLEQMPVSVIDNPDLAAIGQDNLTITPLILARAWIGLMSNGRLPQFQIVSHTRSPEGEWQAVSLPEQEMETAVSLNVARIIQGIFPQTDDGIVEFSATAVSDQDNNLNSWYLATKEIAGERYFVVIILEENKTADLGSEIGRALLRLIEEE